MSKYAGHQVVLAIDFAGGTAFTTIGQVIDISGPGLERNAIDVTSRDSTNYWREFVKGFKDGGEVSLGIRFDPDLATHGDATGLLSDFGDDTTIAAARLSFPPSGANTIVFDAILTGFEPTAPNDDALDADVTLKVSGEPTFTF